MGVRSRTRGAKTALATLLALGGGCYSGATEASGSGETDSGEGTSDGQSDSGSDDSGGIPETPDEALDIPETTALPRLSRREIDATLEDLFGIEGAAERFLPEDPRTVVDPLTGAEIEAYDTHAASKDPSVVFVEGLESMAGDVAREFAADTTRVETMAGCTPQGAWDPDCLRNLIDGLGLRLWRRPLTAEEVDVLLATATEFGEEGGHEFAVRMVTQGLLQSPYFAYHHELGVDAGDGLRFLDNYELVSRMSFLLWGQGPSVEMLERAGGPDIDDDALEELALAAIDDPRAEEQMRAFHALWLRYDELLVTDEALATDMRMESDALVDRVLSGSGTRWSTLLTSSETFVTPSLAEHYGLDEVPSEAGWVTYGDDGRAGLLSHGSFLSLSSTQGSKTLPSRRGSMLAQRILCISIPPPPPDVDVDDGVEVGDDECKIDAYAVHSNAGSSCNGCHVQLDPLGFGFERYNGLGQYRESEPDKPQCNIAAQGTVAGQPFSGPREFASALDEAGLAAQCGVRQLSRFATRSSSDRDDVVERLVEAFESDEQDFRALMVAAVTDPAFRYRKEAL
ncbi:MAG: DUF1588 domain-containing protein [Nannocystales bacterium]